MGSSLRYPSVSSKHKTRNELESILSVVEGLAHYWLGTSWLPFQPNKIWITDQVRSLSSRYQDLVNEERLQLSEK